jgi:hypothetical protein
MVRRLSLSPNSGIATHVGGRHSRPGGPVADPRHRALIGKTAEKSASGDPMMQRYVLEYETSGEGTMVEAYRPTLRAARLCARRLLDRNVAWPPEVRISASSVIPNSTRGNMYRAFPAEDIV